MDSSSAQTLNASTDDENKESLGSGANDAAYKEDDQCRIERDLASDGAAESTENGLRRNHGQEETRRHPVGCNRTLRQSSNNGWQCGGDHSHVQRSDEGTQDQAGKHHPESPVFLNPVSRLVIVASALGTLGHLRYRANAQEC